MADKQISQLVAATTLNNEDLLVIQQGQVAKKLSGERLAMFVYLAAGSMIDEVNSAVEEAQAAVDELLEEKNAIAQTIADMAGLGTDTTLTTPAMAADAKEVGDRIADVEKDALAGLNQKTISDVAIAFFDDGADDAPVKELIVNIDPVQDLHGQDAPYPAGGGVNKFNLDILVPLPSEITTSGIWKDGNGGIKVVASASSAGTAAYNAHFLKLSEFAPNLVVGQTYFLSFTSTGTTKQIYLSVSASVWRQGESRTITQNDLDSVVYFYASGLSTEATITEFQITEGSTAPTEYHPYSNICPITGSTGCEVTRTGKNLYNPNAVTDNCYLSTTTGLPEAQAGYVVSDYIPVIKNQGVIIPASGTARRWFYDKNKNPVTYLGNSGNQLFTPSYDGFIRVSVAKTAIFYNTYIIAYGSGSVPSEGLPTEYEPYSGTTLSITFPDEAGTVYGARLNLTTGKLIVDTAARQFDGSGDVYSFVSNGRVNIDFAGIDYKKGLDKDSGISNSYAGLMQTANNTNFDSSAINYASCYNISASDNNFTVRIKDPRFVDLNTAQGILEEEPLVIIFNLNTPIVYNLTPIEVRTLLKINNIWANTGNINTLIYRTIPITEEVIREIMGDYEEIIAGVEYTGKATKNYYAGNLVIVDDILYKCLVNVASGETFTPGAGGNVSQTTIADELATLQALYDNLGNLALLSYTTA